MKSVAEHTQLIKAEAKRLGFLSCGISQANFLEEEAPRLEKWLNKNMNGEMGYMANYFDKRLDPRLLVDDANPLFPSCSIIIPMNNKRKKVTNSLNTPMGMIIIMS